MNTINGTIRARRPRRPSSGVLAAITAAAAMAVIAVSATAAHADPKPVPGPVDAVSAEVRAKMAAQQPLLAAASRIRWSVERDHATGYAGVGLGTDEVVVWWKGTPPPAVADTLAEVRGRTRVRVVKNKCAQPFEEAEFDIRWGTGVDIAADLLDTALATGAITRSGSHYTHQGKGIGQGRERARAVLLEDHELRAALLEETLGLLWSGAPLVEPQPRPRADALDGDDSGLEAEKSAA